jgi:hypothetical protein
LRLVVILAHDRDGLALDLKYGQRPIVVEQQDVGAAGLVPRRCAVEVMGLVSETHGEMPLQHDRIVGDAGNASASARVIRASSSASLRALGDVAGVLAESLGRMDRLASLVFVSIACLVIGPSYLIDPHCRLTQRGGDATKFKSVGRPFHDDGCRGLTASAFRNSAKFSKRPIMGRFC